MNIILCGGNTLHQGYTERLGNEIRAIAPAVSFLKSIALVLYHHKSALNFLTVKKSCQSIVTTTQYEKDSDIIFMQI